MYDLQAIVGMDIDMHVKGRDTLYFSLPLSIYEFLKEHSQSGTLWSKDQELVG